MKKKLFKGTFNWHGEVLIVWTHAKNEREAFSLMVARLSEKLGYNRAFVSKYFSDPWKDNYKIEEVKK